VFLCAVPAPFASALPAGNAFEGNLHFNVEFKGGDMQDRARVAMLVPESYRLYFKGDQTKILMRGGMIGLTMGEVVIDGSTGRGYVISHMNSKAYEIVADVNLRERVAPVIVDENETISIAGYECRKYKITRTNPSGPMIQYMWVTNAIQLDLAATLEGALKDTMPFWTEGLSGFPLKITTSFPGTSMTMTLTATEVRPQAVDPSIFVVPAGYAIESIDPGQLFGR
jgi:hypothetical protein